MKSSQLRNLIREEVRKVLSEATRVWDKKAINDFFMYMIKIGVVDKIVPNFKSDTTGVVDMRIGSVYRAKFIVDTTNPSNLILIETNPGDFPIDEFEANLEWNDASKKYNYTSKGNKLTINIIK
jgi:hypothetical protein